MSESPVVAVWKENWLPASQTFVANQLDATRRWRPVTVGVRRVADGLPIVPDFAPFDLSTSSRATHRMRATLRYRGVYDSFLRGADARVVHAHFAPSAMSILPVARRLDLPLAVTFHGFDVNELPRAPGSAGRRYRARLRTLFDGATALIAVSTFVQQRLEQLGAPPHKIHVLPIGIPLKDRAVPPSDPRGVAYVGRMIEAKGAIDVVRAVGSLPEDLRASTPVTLSGWGPIAAEVASLATHVGIQASLPGRRSPDEVVQDLAQAQVFCAPSKQGRSGWQEAFGLVFLEAAMQGLPVVSYRHGGVPEAVQDGVTGLLADEGDVSGLAAHLQTLLRDPALARRMGDAGRRRVLRDFDVLRRTEALERLYDQMS